MHQNENEFQHLNNMQRYYERENEDSMLMIRKMLNVDLRQLERKSIKNEDALNVLDQKSDELLLTFEQI